MKRIGIVAVVLCLQGITTNAQLAKHQAAYIFNFTRLIKWPENQNKEAFIIGILGKNQEIAQELEMSATNRSVGNLSIKVIEYSTPEEVKNCQILFIPQNKYGLIDNAVNLTKGQATLIITEGNKNPEGSMINLHLVDQKLAFFINKANADARNIVISEKLLSLSK